MSRQTGVCARSAVTGVAPSSANELHGWLQLALGIDVPRVGVVEGATSPFAYLCHSFFERGMRGFQTCFIEGKSFQSKSEDEEDGELQSPRDCVVWAARGSGKTFYGSVATVLDMLFKPGVEVRVLAGSLEQGQRMQEHLRRHFEQPALAHMVDGKPTERKIVLANGSRCTVLAASQTSVRGVRPQILRCDEADLFDREIWQAAQLTTRSAQCGGVFVEGRVEALSTWHRPAGLMSELVASAEESSAPRKGFRWSVVDVLERCDKARACESCALEEECNGRAKRISEVAQGHMRVDDAVALKRRTDEATWKSEMLCSAPRRTDAVFPEFDEGVHVFRGAAQSLKGNEQAPAEKLPVAHGQSSRQVAGMDFGFRNPTAILFGVVRDDGALCITHEHAASEVTVDAHAQRVAQQSVDWVGVDPAGHQRSDQTGLSSITALRKAGLSVRSRRLPLEMGLRAVRARLKPATGSPTLFVHERCTKLIGALRSYRYGDGGGAGNRSSNQPIKDGHDHICDALRYLIVNLDHPYKEELKRYV